MRLIDLFLAPVGTHYKIEVTVRECVYNYPYYLITVGDNRGPDLMIECLSPKTVGDIIFITGVKGVMKSSDVVEEGVQGSCSMDSILKAFDLGDL